MNNTIWIKAAPGLSLPQEYAPQRLTDDKRAVEVEDSAYYRRALADGDIIRTEAPRTATAKEADNGKS